MGNTLSLTSMGIVKPLNLILHIWNGNSVKGGVSRAKFNCIMSLTFCHYNWLNSAVVTFRLFAPTCKVAEKLSGKVANRTTQPEWERERESEAEIVRHPLLQQHLWQLQLLYLYLVADWRLYLKDFVQTCRKYSSHIRKLFNKLNAAKKSGKMRKRKTKAESQKLLQAKRKLYQLGRWTGPGQSEARAGQNFSHRAISFACVRCRCLWPQLQLQLQLLFLQLLIK